MKTYRTLAGLLFAMVTNGELTNKQAQNFRDAYENEKAIWRNNLISAVNRAYEYGQRHDPIGRGELINEIIGGQYDV